VLQIGNKSTTPTRDPHNRDIWKDYVVRSTCQNKHPWGHLSSPRRNDTRILLAADWTDFIM